jgi:hypothetical protein
MVQRPDLAEADDDVLDDDSGRCAGRDHAAEPALSGQPARAVIVSAGRG